MSVEKGKVRLSDRVIFGLLALAVFDPNNEDQTIPAGPQVFHNHTPQAQHGS